MFVYMMSLYIMLIMMMNAFAYMLKLYVYTAVYVAKFGNLVVVVWK